MRALVQHLKYRIVAGIILAMTGNSSAAANANDRDVQNFKPFSLFQPQTNSGMRPQTIKASRVSNSGGTQVMAPIVFTRLPQEGAETSQPSPLKPPPPAPPATIAAPPAPPASPSFPAPPKLEQPAQVIPPVGSTTPKIPKVETLPPIAPPANKTDAVTTAPGAGCVECQKGLHQDAPAGFEPKDLNAGQYHSVQEKCYSQELLKAAKSNVRNRFDNKPASGGLCAYGVRTSINAAGIYGGTLGNAVDYQIYNRAAAIGMKNYISEYGDDMSKIPPGAVLVFSGRNTPEYMRTGYEGPRGSKGNWLGHVTIKGDDGRFYTDGRTDQPAVGWPRDKSSRKLVGVYIMHQCTGSCSKALRDKCG